MNSHKAGALFVTEGSYQIGMGHVSRCGNLARELLRKGIQSHFLLRDAGEYPETLLANLDFPKSWFRGFGEVDAELERRNPKVVILDSYSIGPDTISGSALEGRLRVLIDDFVERDYDFVDLVVNPLPSEELASFSADRVLAGPLHSLVHEAFQKARDSLPDFTAPPSRIGLVLGSTDPRGQGREIVPVIHEVWPDARIDVAGASSSASAFNYVQVLGPIAPLAMAQFLREADLVFVTPSTIAWEVAAVGTPAILVETMDNHVWIARAMERVPGVAVTRKVTAEAIRQYWNSLTPASLSTWSSLNDGLGTSRVAEAILARLS